MASSQTAEKRSLFSLGRLVATPAALDILQAAGQTPFEFIFRHLHGDWGECCKADARENDLAVKQGNRIFSVYKTRAGETLQVMWNTDSGGMDSRD